VPAGLSTSISISRVRVVTLMASASAHQFPLKLAPGNSARLRSAVHTGFDPLRVSLRDVYVKHAIFPVSDVKEVVFTPPPIPELMKSRYGVARGDHAIEGGVDFSKDTRLNTVYGCLSASTIALIRIVGADRVSTSCVPRRCYSEVLDIGSW